jgi:DhnA family fructose-bisphosphate aldolase class Ia
LKIPHCKEFDRVAKSTTCPILMLGGESLGNLSVVFQEFCDGMAAGQNVRGALVGRNVLYPGQEDPSAVADAVSKIVHENFTVERALNHIKSVRGHNMQKMTSVIA